MRRIFFIILLLPFYLYGIKIIGCGDIVIGTVFPHYNMPSDGGYSMFKYIKPILKKGDIVFGNLEGVIGDKDSLKCVKDTTSGHVYAFLMPPKSAEVLKDAGFNVISLANNHSKDFGMKGLKSSVKCLREVGIQPLTKYGDIAEFTIDSLRICVVGFSFGYPPGSIVYPKKPLEKIAELDSLYDIVIVSVHAGKEGKDAVEVKDTMEVFYGEKRGNPYRFAHDAIDRGADLVLMHGPHVPRKTEIYAGRLIVYSMGNCVSYRLFNISGISGYTPIFEIDLNNDGTLKDYKIHSFIQYGNGPVPDPKERARRFIEKLYPIPNLPNE